MIVGYSKMLLLGPPMGLQIRDHITKNSNCKNWICCQGSTTALFTQVTDAAATLLPKINAISIVCEL